MGKWVEYNWRLSMEKQKKIVSIDERGRITIPSESRKGIDSFIIESGKDGTIKLIPQKAVSANDAKILESLKVSVNQFKKRKTKKVPQNWIE